MVWVDERKVEFSEFTLLFIFTFTLEPPIEALAIAVNLRSKLNAKIRAEIFMEFIIQQRFKGFIII
ncbi:hypothetical protein A3H19_01045 [Candidatus Woesebacteria bacterium RIFCSPLOWO2_12_FULL_39_9]|nr:MAG: hypothetical protein A3H19_01045 [Candidatus Woesebacteria bacterium RIFCSPLOWO2_12_FULL_39_9]